MGKIARPATFGGKSCGSLVETRTCFHASCPTDCIVSQWGTWGSCSKSCGSGAQWRFRTVTTRPDTHGKKCPQLRAVQECNKLNPCPVHCSVGHWGHWGACSASCGTTGIQQRTRTVISRAEHGGYICPSLSGEQSCNRNDCPTNCIVTEWGSWSGCSATVCGPGLLTRKREVWAAATNGGKDCPMLKNQEACTAGPCAIDCTVSSWASFTSCSKSCGGGKKVRMRWVTQQAYHKGTICPVLKEVVDCNAHHCPIDCVMAEWKVWGECSASCSTGTRTRSRVVSVPANLGGKPCSLIVSQTSSCFRGPCPQECKVSAWGAWGECSKPCGSGFRVRTRSVVQMGIYHKCPWLSATDRCNNHSCTPPSPVVDNPIYMWGGGDWVFKPTLAPAPAPKPNDCIVGSWGSWLACSKSCGSGTKRRKRFNVEPTVGGQTCPHSTETQPCLVEPCGHGVTDCKWGTGASETWVADGWVGNGWGENSCAPCHCISGNMKCSYRKKSCSNLAKLKLCSAQTTCAFEFNYKAGHNVMVIHAKQGETVGSQHHCAFNFKSRKCECRCWGAVQTMIWDDSNVVTTKAKVVLPVDDGAAPVIVDQKAFHEVPVMAPSFLLTASTL
jgi:hypothetical protein